jgi:hypothetical protein
MQRTISELVGRASTTHEFRSSRDKSRLTLQIVNGRLTPLDIHYCLDVTRKRIRRAVSTRTNNMLRQHTRVDVVGMMSGWVYKVQKQDQTAASQLCCFEGSDSDGDENVVVSVALSS